MAEISATSLSSSTPLVLLSSSPLVSSSSTLSPAKYSHLQSMLVSNLKILRKVLDYLDRYDAMSYLKYLDTLRVFESFKFVWIFAESTYKIFDHAKKRVYCFVKSDGMKWSGPTKSSMGKKRKLKGYGLPLKVVSYKDLYGWIMKMIGLKHNYTFCGVFRHQALDQGAAMLKVDKVATGHNADDIAKAVLLNILRGDIARLSRCTAITTGKDGPL
ncbi:hypothetical protein FNV43_RR05885 [Rhamnella rubrinervis]|uniref:Uncharacterized protein n=1 Tax=Rhamnella rubrinervis TaxID=2594499 RepID=A0A8K0HC05_9ROSA|nr:hypothetical protein FNV43_RR05885 [Rhamnella rubrinervis]